MADERPGPSVRLLYPFAKVLKLEGVPLEELLSAAELPRALFDDLNARLSYPLAGRFLLAAYQRTKHRALGLEAAKHQDMAQFHLLEYLVSSSSTVESALGDLVRNQGVFGDVRVFSIVPHGEDLLLRYQSLNPQPRLVVEYVLGGLALSARRNAPRRRPGLPQRKLRVGSVWFAFKKPVKAFDEYRAFFGDDMVFDAPHNGLLVLRDAARRKQVRANPVAREAIEQQLQAQIEGAGHTRSLSDRVRSLITAAIPGGDFSQDAIARKLGLGRTTLKRRLAAEGTGVREVVDEVRKTIALRALAQPELSVIEVAFRAGYDDATAFNKAFKRWTGTSPVQYRTTQRVDPLKPR